MAMRVVGLDIGSRAVRGVELSVTKKSRLNLLRFHEIPLPPGAVSRGEVVEPEVVGSALKKLWSEAGFKSKNVVLGTGSQRTLVRDLTLPKASLKDIRESLPFQVQSMLQIPLEDSLLDFYSISESTGERGLMVNGLLIVAQKSEILANIHIAQRAGLTPVEVDLIPFALNRLLVGRSEVKGTVALIEVGGSTTSIIIASDGVPWFVRIIPAGGEDLTQALASGLEISVEAAEKLKRTLRYGAHSTVAEVSRSETLQHACPNCSAELPSITVDPRATEILQTVTGELLASLHSTVNYFNNTRPGDPVLQVLLTGGGAQLPGFAQGLSELTHIPVSEADPFAMITLARGLKAKKLQESRPSISLALGLALRSLS